MNSAAKLFGEALVLHLSPGQALRVSLMMHIAMVRCHHHGYALEVLMLEMQIQVLRHSPAAAAPIGYLVVWLRSAKLSSNGSCEHLGLDYHPVH